MFSRARAVHDCIFFAVYLVQANGHLEIYTAFHAITMLLVNTCLPLPVFICMGVAVLHPYMIGCQNFKNKCANWRKA